MKSSRWATTSLEDGEGGSGGYWCPPRNDDSRGADPRRYAAGRRKIASDRGSRSASRASRGNPRASDQEPVRALAVAGCTRCAAQAVSFRCGSARREALAHCRNVHGVVPTSRALTRVSRPGSSATPAGLREQVEPSPNTGPQLPTGGRTRNAISSRKCSLWL